MSAQLDSGDVVFVLGAGASKPYGFPLGHELRANILSETSGGTGHYCKLLGECGFPQDLIREFHEDLRDAIHGTIDDFLAERSSYRALGMHCIAASLAQCETHDTLFPKRDWYPNLFKLLDPAGSESRLLGVVTLNYDRSLEHFLWTIVRRSYEAKKRDQALARLEEFPIIHVHGQLGVYPERSYGPMKTRDDIVVAAEALQITADETLDRSMHYEKARNLCAKASTVVFIGCGYHAKVLDRLSATEWLGGKRILGTGSGVLGHARERIKQHFAGKIELAEHHVNAQQFIRSEFGQPS